jgi:hypothetical protein
VIEWIGPFASVCGMVITMGFGIWAARVGSRSQAAAIERQRGVQAAWEAQRASDEADEMIARHRERKRLQHVFELSVVDLLLAGDRFTVHPEFVRVWRDGASIEWLLDSEEKRAMIDALGLRFDSFERPTPAPQAAQVSDAVVAARAVLRARTAAEARPLLRGMQFVERSEEPPLGTLWTQGHGPVEARIVNVSQAEYDALPVKDPRTMYRIIDAPKPTMLMRTADYEALVREAKERR